MRRAVPPPPLLALAPLAACGEADMADQARAKTWDKNPFFPREITMRQPVAGTVPRSDPRPSGAAAGRPSAGTCSTGAGSATRCSARPATARTGAAPG